MLLWPAFIEGKDKPEIILYLPSDEGKGTVDPDRGLNDQVMSATYSPDGKRIASVGGGGRQLTAGEKERYGILD